MPAARRMRAMPLAGRRLVARARGEHRAGRPRPRTGSPSTCSSRTSPLPRRRVSPSSEPAPSRNGQRGSTTSRTRRRGWTQPAARRPGAPRARQSALRSRWTSIRNEFDDDDLAERARLLALLGRLAGAAARDDRDRRGAGDEARWRRARRPARRGPTGRRRRGSSSTPGLSATTGRPSTTSPSATSPSSSTTKHRHYRPRRTCMVPNTRSQYGRADPEAALVVLEVVAHVQLPQPLPEPRARRVVVQVVVDHVVGQIAGEEAGAERERPVGAEHEPEQPRRRPAPAAPRPRAA